MLKIGLTGGIGSGKSSVSRLLAEQGAVVIDADLIARDVVRPGTPGLAQVATRFGAGVLTADGSLDRAALGAIVFADSAARRDLEGITHPLIATRTDELVQRAGSDAIVVHDQPLLVEMGLAAAHQLTVVVGASERTRIERMVRDRGMNESDARARIEAQATDADRRAAADVWLDNDGSRVQLQTQVTTLWEQRVAPFEANLRTDHRVRHAPVGSVVPGGSQRSAQAARAMARLEYQLDRAGFANSMIDHLGSTVRSGLLVAGVIELRMQSVQDVERPRFAQALRDAGIVGLEVVHDAHDASRRWVAGGADPVAVVEMSISVPESGR